jgi:FtsP/CotA-like multicopper oxidase with cupredoxin domain
LAAPGHRILAAVDQQRSFLGWTSIAIAIGALVLGFFALAQVGDGGGESASAAAPTVIDIELGSLRLVPSHLMAPPGPIQLRVTNTDAQPHNLSVAGETTPDLQPGQSQLLDLGDVGEGTYDMLCEIAGHAAAGMTGQLMVQEGATPGGVEDAMSMEEMEALMVERAKTFPASTEGLGGQRMDFTTDPDGTKVFDVTAEIVQWETEPGIFVEAWTYNGVVPAPEIHVEVGDKVRIVLHNELPESTVIHFHGIRVPNAMDGVDPYTQDAVKPGESFTYEFEALEPAIGIYHSHHNGQYQIPNGLFGAFTIGEVAIPDVLIERGFAATPTQTINMVLNDAGTIGLSLNGKSFPATQPYTAKVGDTVIVHYFNEGLQMHPMHLHQPSGWIIAKDGVPMLTPVPGDTIAVAPGERYTVVYKMTDPGVWAWHCHILTHAERSDGMFGMVTAFIIDA